MPYIIFDTTQSYQSDEQKLSYSKAVKLNIGVEFINNQLDYAYSSGELEALAKKEGYWTNDSTPEEKAEAIKSYYMHHCPSWTSGLIIDDE